MDKRKKILLAFLFLMGGILVAVGCYKFRPDEVLAYEIKDFTFSGRDTLKYRFFEPKLSNDTSYPLVVFLHGAGARGSNNLTQLWMIKPYLLDSSIRERFPCYLLIPQCKKGLYGWPGMRDGFLSSPLEEVERIIERKIAENKIDTTRIYLIGHSMGAAGVWEMLAYRPHKYAAAVVMCGWSHPDILSKINHVPIWAFHGAKDKTVGPESVRKAVADLRSVDSPIKYTEYPEGEHNSWKMVFEEPELLPWLFSIRKESY